MKLIVFWRLILPVLTVVAFWPLWPWLVKRWFATGGESLYGGLFCVIAAGVCAVLLRGRSQVVPLGIVSLLVATGFLLAAGILYSHLPKLISTGLFFCALYWAIRAALTPRERDSCFALWPLLLLCLPLTPSVQFICGYPLRALAAQLAALVLPGGVHALGCGLTDGAIEVYVDAPCAGAGMLISSLLLAAGSGLLFRLNWWRTVILLLAGLLSALVANALRAALLYAGTTGMIVLPLHRQESATGIFCFAASCALLALLARYLGRGQHTSTFSPKSSHHDCWMWSPVAALYLIICLLLAGSLLTRPDRASEVSQSPTILWPQEWEGCRLLPVPAASETARFWQDFPGRCQEFIFLAPAGGGRATVAERVVLRYVQHATRLLHPAEDCFRGAGFAIKPLPLLLDRQGRRWSGFTCEKSGRSATVRQCVIEVPGPDLRSTKIFATASRCWPDPSAWYWDAARPGTNFTGAALAITILTEKLVE